MNFKLYLSILLLSLLTIVNSLAIKEEDINLNKQNVKYSKSVGYKNKGNNINL